MICPKCGALHDDNWCIRVDGRIMLGGCQMCWEAECAATWWDYISHADRHRLFEILSRMWIDVEVCLPKPERQVMLFCQQGRSGWIALGSLDIHGEWQGYDAVNVTHWMPLPEPPPEFDTSST